MEHSFVTIGIMIITVLVSLGAFNNNKVYNDLIFYPPAISHNGQWYRFFSSGLIHADYGHLIFNMLSLYFFGIGQEIRTPLGSAYTGVESEFVRLFGNTGHWVYLGMYILALFVALIPTYSKNKDNSHYYGLGASGAVSAVIFAGILLQPTMMMGLFFIPVYVAGFIFGAIYLFVSSWLDRRGVDNINHSAHIFGAIFGLGFVIVSANLFSDTKVVQEFIEKIQSMSPSQFIRFGSGF